MVFYIFFYFYKLNYKVSLFTTPITKKGAKELNVRKLPSYFRTPTLTQTKSNPNFFELGSWNFSLLSIFLACKRISILFLYLFILGGGLLCLWSRAPVRVIMEGTVSKGWPLMVEDTFSTMCTEIFSKFPESMFLSGLWGVGPTALFGNNQDFFSLVFVLLLLVYFQLL